MRSFAATSLLVLLSIAGCSGSGGSDKGTGSSAANSQSGAGSAPGNLNAGVGEGNTFIPTADDGTGQAAGGSAANGGTTPGGQEDTCDGIDNDGNGIIDDVDVGMDGICDCLLIATLGEPGQWGEGDVFETWLDARSANGATSLGDAVLTAETLAPFQVIVAQDVSVIGRAYDQSEIDALQNWVNNGGGLMTLIGYADPDERTNVNTLLQPFGIQYGAEQIAQKSGSSTVPISDWTTHPITNGVDMVGVDNGYPVDGGGTVIATVGDYTIGRAMESNSGHVFVWGDEWITYNSEWNQHPDYQVELFWVNSVKWLTPADMCQVPIPDTIPHVIK